MANKPTFKIPKELYKRIFLVLVSFLGVTFSAYVVQSLTRFKLKAASTPVQITLSPTDVKIPPSTSFSLLVDPQYQGVSFVDVILYFDPNVLQLTSNIDTSSSPLSGVQILTPMSEANATGNIEIALYQTVDQTTPDSPFQLATLNFEAKSEANVPETEITIGDEASHIVSATGSELDFEVGYVNVNQGQPKNAAHDAMAAAAPQHQGSGNCPSEDYIDTAIGCIPYGNNTALAKFFLSWGVGIAGGIAFVLIVFAAYQIMTSSGDPKRLSAGKSLLTAAIAGLLLVIMSAFILRLVGVNVLGIF